MTAVRFRSSGNLTADRRFDYAIDLLEAGDTVAAGDLIEQALELAPDWPAGWFRLAEARAASGDIGAAIAAYRRAGDLDPADTLGARLRLARLGGIDTPAQPPAAYVRGLFDDYADRFDHALVDGLAYRAPDLIAAALAVASGDGRFGSCLDLGCGTGLMAEALRSRVGAFVGIDLSQGMIDKARAPKGSTRRCWSAISSPRCATCRPDAMISSAPPMSSAISAISAPPSRRSHACCAQAVCWHFRWSASCHPTRPATIIFPIACGSGLALPMWRGSWSASVLRSSTHVALSNCATK